jgi:tripartite-type tricarboxylate transporter receptor subunit TctC
LDPIIIENVSGADGTIGVSRAARAKPDGHVISLVTMSTFVLSSPLYSPPYDIFNDFAPITPLATTPFVLFTRNSSMIGFFQKETGTRFTLVPYGGSPTELQDLFL